MPDLGHELTFGVFLPNPASQAATVVRLAVLAEQRGLDLVGVQDHPYNADLLDTWTLLAHLAAATETIRLFPDVACLPLRPAAVLARSAASLDLLTNGRVEIGLGAGYFLDPIAGMGGPRLTRGESVDALHEAIAVMRAIWSADEPITLPGRFHHLENAQPGPRPAHDIGIWVGSYQTPDAGPDRANLPMGGSPRRPTRRRKRPQSSTPGLISWRPTPAVSQRTSSGSTT